MQKKMVFEFPLSSSLDKGKQVPVGLEGLRLLKSSIEKYEDWKSSLNERSLNIKSVHEENSIRIEDTSKRSLSSFKENRLYRRSKPIFLSDVSVNKDGKKRMENKKTSVISIKTLKDVSDSKTINNPSSKRKTFLRKDASIKSAEKLCLDTTRQTQSVKFERRIKIPRKIKMLRKEYERICAKKEGEDKSLEHIEPSLPCDCEDVDWEKITKQRHEERRLPYLSEILIDLHRQGVKEEEASDIRILPVNPLHPDGAPMYIIPEPPLEPELKQVLEEAKYTKSEMDVLFSELRSFSGVEEAIGKFSEMLSDDDELSKTSPKGKTDLKELIVEEEDQEQETDIELTETHSAGVFGEETGEEVFSGEGETEDEVEEVHVDVRPSQKREIVRYPQLQGILYNAMSRYYSSRLEGLMTIQDCIDVKNEKEFHDILYGAIKEQGLPKNEEALRTFLSNITGIPKDDRSISHATAAEYYESIYLKKVERTEKYPDKGTEPFVDLYAQKYPVEKDLYELLSPYLQTIHEEVRDEKVITKKKKKKLKKKKKIVEEENGPFNVLLRPGVPNPVWRSALKKLKKKAELLKRVIEHRQNDGPQYEKYHKHFASYFKKKRKEIKRIRKSRKTSTLVKALCLNLSEAESTTSLSSGDHYPERELMNSIMHNYKEKTEFPIPPLERKKRKLGKFEKLKKEKMFQRSGCGGGIRGALNTPEVEKTWHEKAEKAKFKRRARVAEEYLYSSCDELTGLKGPPGKEEMKVTIKELADQLLTDQNPTKPKEPSELESEESEKEPEESIEAQRDLSEDFFLVCSKNKLMIVYELVKKYRLLKPPYDEMFMKAMINLSDCYEPYELMGSKIRYTMKKLFKLAVRTVFGMYITAQQKKELLGFPDGNVSEDKCDSAIPRKFNLRALISNATIQKERSVKWMRHYFGIENTLNTERNMSLYFGPDEEAWVNIGPMKTKPKKKIKLNSL